MVARRHSLIHLAVFFDFNKFTLSVLSIWATLDKRRIQMRSFPSTDLKQTFGDVLDAASFKPGTITQHKKLRFVLMSIREGMKNIWLN